MCSVFVKNNYDDDNDDNDNDYNDDDDDDDIFIYTQKTPDTLQVTL